LLLTSVACSFAYQQRDAARRQQRVSVSRQLAAESELHSSNATVAALLAVASWRIAPTDDARRSITSAVARLGGVGPTAPLAGQAGAVHDLALSPDGHTFAAASTDDTVHLWTARKGRHIATLTGHTDFVSAVAFSPDGATLATGSYDRTARLWNAHTGQLIATLTGHTDFVNAVAFSPDGPPLATASDDRTAQ